ncbi:MAG: DUF2442 domain-containing protein [Acidobacteria bacterium]|nr:DUF2442 domain-containing protein [Acidobacteriota bacterium]
MHWDVTEVNAERGHVLWVKFRDGVAGRVRFEPDFFVGVFAPLRSPDHFEQVFIDMGAVSWPGDLDLAPDAMYREIKAHGEWRLPSAHFV